jgi:protein-disulfide isomerase
MLERAFRHLYNSPPYEELSSAMVTRRFLLAGMTGFAATLAAAPLLQLASLPAAAAATWEKPGDMAVGAPEAPISMIEYFSLTCQHCRDFHTKTFPHLKTNFIDTGKVRFIARDFPLNRPALDAAILAQCAGPKRYFAFIETLFNTFDSWTRSADYIKALGQLGQLGGVSAAQFEDCRGDAALEAKIFATMLDAQETYDVKSTPTFIINGKTHEGGMHIDSLAKTLDQYLPDN